MSHRMWACKRSGGGLMLVTGARGTAHLISGLLCSRSQIAWFESVSLSILALRRARRDAFIAERNHRASPFTRSNLEQPCDALDRLLLRSHIEALAARLEVLDERVQLLQTGGGGTVREGLPCWQTGICLAAMRGRQRRQGGLTLAKLRDASAKTESGVAPMSSGFLASPSEEASRRRARSLSQTVKPG